METRWAEIMSYAQERLDNPHAHVGHGNAVGLTFQELHTLVLTALQSEQRQEEASSLRAEVERLTRERVITHFVDPDGVRDPLWAPRCDADCAWKTHDMEDGGHVGCHAPTRYEDKTTCVDCLRLLLDDRTRERDEAVELLAAADACSACEHATRPPDCKHEHTCRARDAREFLARVKP